LIHDEPFAVLLPDDVIIGDKPCLKQMIDAHENTGGSLVAAMEVSEEDVSSYGVLDVKEDMGSVVSIRGMVEKPDAKTAPSNLAVIGRYILSHHLMRNLDKTKRGSGGEIQLTDAIAQEISNGRDVHGFRFRGRRFDCGSKIGFLKATVAIALERNDLGAEFGHFLENLAELTASDYHVANAS
jgi:UTP--glucose-1-phosphate uridylyltransferase